MTSRGPERSNTGSLEYDKAYVQLVDQRGLGDGPEGTSLQ